MVFLQLLQVLCEVFIAEVFAFGLPEEGRDRFGSPGLAKLQRQNAIAERLQPRAFAGFLAAAGAKALPGLGVVVRDMARFLETRIAVP